MNSINGIAPATLCKSRKTANISTGFLSKSLSVAIIFLLCVQGCSARWVDVALQDLPIIINLALQIAQMANPGADQDIKEYGQEAAADLQLVKELITEYNSGKDASGNPINKANTIAKMTQILTEVSSHLQNILAAAHVRNTVLDQHIAEAVNLAIVFTTTVTALVSGQKTTQQLPSPIELQAALDVLQSPLYRVTP